MVYRWSLKYIRSPQSLTCVAHGAPMLRRGFLGWAQRCRVHLGTAGRRLHCPELTGYLRHDWLDCFDNYPLCDFCRFQSCQQVNLPVLLKMSRCVKVEKNLMFSFVVSTIKVLSVLVRYRKLCFSFDANLWEDFMSSDELLCSLSWKEFSRSEF